MHKNDFDYKVVEYNFVLLIKNNHEEDVFYVLTSNENKRIYLLKSFDYLQQEVEEIFQIVNYYL